MFYGREEELAELDALWRKGTASLVTCRGRRRIGKSTLIEEFARRSKAKFLRFEGLAPEPRQKNADQIRYFGERLKAQRHGGGGMPESWHDAFAALDAAIGKGRTVVLLDEISWMGRLDPNFPGYIKSAWDLRLKHHRNLILVLCGSVSAWIADNILSNTGFVGRLSRDLVLRELPLKDAVRFWGKKADAVGTMEVFDVLSVTGAVPRYLEEIDPSLSADENIRRLCFLPGGTLFSDFAQIFTDVFGVNAYVKRAALRALAKAPMTCAELADDLGVGKGGSLSRQLDELVLAGFVARDSDVNPKTGKAARECKYRLCDNYTRFYLHYIEPNAVNIKNGKYKFVALEGLRGWNSILGLQFENLVVNNFEALLGPLGLKGVEIVSAAPYRKRGKKGEGCQIDLLIQTRRALYVVEIKRREVIGAEVEDEVERKVVRLPRRPGMSVRKVLVYEGRLSKEVEADGYFDFIVPGARLMGC